MTNLAVIGLGTWGQRHVRSARASGRFNVVAAADPDAIRAAPIAEKLDLMLVSSLQEILDDSNISALTLATPHTLHADQVIMAARSGKHVYTEKPFALNAQDARRAVKAAEEGGIQIALGHDQRHYPVIKRLGEMIANDTFGKILHIETNLSHGSVADLYKEATLKKGPEPARGWRLCPNEVPMGPISQFGIHRLDTFIHLLGKIDWVFAASSAQGINPSFIDTLSITVGFESGVTGYLGNSVATPLHSSLRIFGTKIWAESGGPVTFNEYRECSLVNLVVFSEGSRKEQKFEIIDSVANNFESFADSIEGKSNFIISPEEMVHNIAVVDAIGVSLETGKKVMVKT